MDNDERKKQTCKFPERRRKRNLIKPAEIVSEPLPLFKTFEKTNCKKLFKVEVAATRLIEDKASGYTNTMATDWTTLMQDLR